jgi:hypothetical protein
MKRGRKFNGHKKVVAPENAYEVYETDKWYLFVLKRYQALETEDGNNNARWLVAYRPHDNPGAKSVYCGIMHRDSVLHHARLVQTNPLRRQNEN